MLKNIVAHWVAFGNLLLHFWPRSLMICFLIDQFFLLLTCNVLFSFFWGGGSFVVVVVGGFFVFCFWVVVFFGGCDCFFREGGGGSCIRVLLFVYYQSLLIYWFITHLFKHSKLTLRFTLPISKMAGVFCWTENRCMHREKKRYLIDVIAGCLTYHQPVQCVSGIKELWNIYVLPYMIIAVSPIPSIMTPGQPVPSTAPIMPGIWQGRLRNVNV